MTNDSVALNLVNCRLIVNVCSGGGNQLGLLAEVVAGMCFFEDRVHLCGRRMCAEGGFVGWSRTRLSGRSRRGDLLGCYTKLILFKRAECTFKKVIDH